MLGILAGLEVLRVLFRVLELLKGPEPEAGEKKAREGLGLLVFEAGKDLNIN